MVYTKIRGVPEFHCWESGEVTPSSSFPLIVDWPFTISRFTQTPGTYDLPRSIVPRPFTKVVVTDRSCCRRH